MILHYLFTKLFVLKKHINNSLSGLWKLRDEPKYDWQVLLFFLAGYALFSNFKLIDNLGFDYPNFLSTVFFDFATFITMLYFLIDLFEEARFRLSLKDDDCVSLLTLDNLYLSYYLTEVFKDNDIKFHFKAQKFRELFLILNPLFKINLLVSQEDLSKAQKIIKEIDIQEV